MFWFLKLISKGCCWTSLQIFKNGRGGFRKLSVFPVATVTPLSPCRRCSPPRTPCCRAPPSRCSIRWPLDDLRSPLAPSPFPRTKNPNPSSHFRRCGAAATVEHCRHGRRRLRPPRDKPSPPTAPPRPPLSHHPRTRAGGGRDRRNRPDRKSVV